MAAFLCCSSRSTTRVGYGLKGVRTRPGHSRACCATAETGHERPSEVAPTRVARLDSSPRIGGLATSLNACIRVPRAIDIASGQSRHPVCHVSGARRRCGSRIDRPRFRLIRHREVIAVQPRKPHLRGRLEPRPSARALDRNLPYLHDARGHRTRLPDRWPTSLTRATTTASGARCSMPSRCRPGATHPMRSTGGKSTRSSSRAGTLSAGSTRSRIPATTESSICAAGPRSWCAARTARFVRSRTPAATVAPGSSTIPGTAAPSSAPTTRGPTGSTERCSAAGAWRRPADSTRTATASPRFGSGIWAGFIFVCFSDECRGTARADLDTWLGDLPEQFGSYRFETFELVRRRHYDLDCNWKLYIENAMEDYHTPTVHKSSIGLQETDLIPTIGEWDSIHMESEATIAVLLRRTPHFPFECTVNFPHDAHVDGSRGSVRPFQLRVFVGTSFTVLYPTTFFGTTQDCMWWLQTIRAERPSKERRKCRVTSRARASRRRLGACGATRLRRARGTERQVLQAVSGTSRFPRTMRCLSERQQAMW